PGLRVLHDDEPGPSGPPSATVKRADPDRSADHEVWNIPLAANGAVCARERNILPSFPFRLAGRTSCTQG
ncbi:MAG: hypothetical protein ACYTGC_08895, partial [Planctomycetota bacterium]